MPTLKEMMAAKAAWKEWPAAETGDAPPPRANPLPPPESFATPPREGYLARQDGKEPLPNDWPPDTSDFCNGADLIVVQNPHSESFLALKLPSGKVKYLMGPLPTLNLPF